MSFLSPALLVALPAVLIPLIIHLLHRRRFQKKSWGAMMFLREAMEEKRGRRKLRHWLLLGMRMLAIAALIFGMSRPLVGGWLAGWIGGGDHTVSVVMDRSASMERQLTAGGPTKRETAIKTLIETANRVSPSELWVLDSATNETRPLQNWETLTSTDTKADVPVMMLEAFKEWERTQQARGELWIVSDLQASSWQAESSNAWADVQAAYRKLSSPPTLRFLTLPGGQANRSIRCQAIQRQLAITIHQESADEVTIPITVKRGDQSTIENVALLGETTTLELSMPEEGEVSGSVSLPGDGNARDNTAYFAFGEEPRPHVAVVCEEPDVESILALAASPTGLVDIKREVTWEDEALVLWQGSLPNRSTEMELFLQAGGQMLIFPSATASAAEESLTIRQWSHDEGPLRDTRAGEPLGLEKLRTFRHTKLEGGTVLAVLENEAPWLVERPDGEGSAYFCATLPLYTWSTLGDGMVLVPATQRLLAKGQDRFSRVRWASVNEDPWQAGVFPRESGWDVRVRPLEEDGLDEVSEEALTGLMGDLPFQQFALKGGKQTQEAVSEWWRPVLFLGMLFLLVESLLTMMPRQQREPVANS